jgi:uncharacterized membrane protein
LGTRTEHDHTRPRQRREDAGAAVGAALDATSGLGGDVVMSSLDSDFVDSVTTEMRPGMTAIIVEADEKSTRPVDDIIAIGGRHLYRQSA